MKALTQQEKEYFKQIIRGEDPGPAAVNALYKAVKEGRNKLDMSDPEIKQWSDGVDYHISCMELLDKRDRKEKLTKEEIQIIKDYEEFRQKATS